MNKYYKFIAIVFVILICSCKGENTKKAKVVESINDKDSITVFDFSANLSKGCSIDTLSYDNLIKSVRYIPLETNENSMLGKGDITVRMIAGKFIVSTGRGNFLILKEFDLNGKYISNLFNIGRGRNEIPLPYYWIANDSLNEIIIGGNDKMILFNVTTGDLSDVRLKESFFNLTGILLCNSTIVKCLFNADDPRTGTTDYPYMSFIDASGKIISERCYPTERDIAYSPISGVSSYPFETYLLKSTNYGAIFKDLYNDTIYAIRSKDNIRARYVVKRGNKYMPIIEEALRSGDKKSDKIYFTDIIDSPEYLFISYYLDNNYNTSIWKKNEGKLIASYSGIPRIDYKKYYWEYMAIMPFFFDGFKGVLPIDYVTADNKIYVGVNASQLMNVLPDLKDDDNPVIIEITLK